MTPESSTSDRRHGTRYFDERGSTYDQNDVHHRLAQLLVDGVDLKGGQQVLDLATGTGLLALEAARRVGERGQVIGLDLSTGMLAQARRKTAEERLSHVTFLEGDAEQLEFEDGQFDVVLCSSALVLMSDPLAALREWVRVLKRGGTLAFDVPDRVEFGPGAIIAEVAQDHGVLLAYTLVAGTLERCRHLLDAAGLDVQSVRTERLQDTVLPLEAALAVWERSLPHPAWQALVDLGVTPVATRKSTLRGRPREGRGQGR